MARISNNMRINGTVTSPVYVIDDYEKLNNTDELEGKIVLVGKEIVDELKAYKVINRLLDSGLDKNAY